MNKQKKKELSEIILGYNQCRSQIKTFNSKIEDIIADERDSVDNLMQYPQFEEKATEKEEECDQLQDAYDQTEEILTTMEDIINILEELSN